MKKYSLFSCMVLLLLASACTKSYDCNCTKTVNGLLNDSYVSTGDGDSPIDVCNAKDNTSVVGNDTTIVDCEPK